jgi:hypothetical protein
MPVISAHDPDTVTLEKASNAAWKTVKIVEGSIAY